MKDALLINQGEGSFKDASEAFGVPLDRPSLGATAADFDADRFIDLYLTGVGDNRLLRNLRGAKFEDVTEALKVSGPKAVSPSARWLDLDQDGDLDLIVLNYCPFENAGEAFLDKPPPGLVNSVFRNDGVPTPVDPNSPRGTWTPIGTATANAKHNVKGGLSLKLTPWTGKEVEALLAGNAPHTGLAQLDIDNDRDLNIVFCADGPKVVVALNDRLGRFHAENLPFADKNETLLSGLLVTDLDLDGLDDLVSLQSGKEGHLALWRNRLDRNAKQPKPMLESWPIDSGNWRSATAIDLDLDGRADLLGVLRTIRPRRSGREARAIDSRRHISRSASKRDLSPA